MPLRTTFAATRELAQCTFKPTINDAPEYIHKIAKSVRPWNGGAGRTGRGELGADRSRVSYPTVRLLIPPLQMALARAVKQADTPVEPVRPDWR